MVQQQGPERMRNVVLLSHGGAGKTSLAEAMLYSAGAVSRLGRVDQGNTTSDYDPDEIKRKISIYLSLLPCQWQGNRLTIIDTPGYADFVGEVLAAVRVADGACVVVCAASGVEVGTEQVWDYADEQSLPRLVFINKMDRENADFDKVVSELQARFGARCLPIELPIGAEASFQGVVDLIAMKARTGPTMEEGEVPEGLRGQAEELREKLVEAVAETDDALLTKYLDGEQLSDEELEAGLRAAILSGAVVPVMAGSALQGVGAQGLLNAIGQYLPSPLERPQTTTEGEEVAPDPSGPLGCLVFKTSADPYVGKLTYFRVICGTMSSDSTVWNSTKGRAERIGQLYRLVGKAQEAVPHLIAGDIGAVAKLAETTTGDTLCQREHPLRFPAIEFPRPSFSVAVYPKTKADLDKLGSSITRLVEEDPSLSVHRDTDTTETILSGMGEAHLEVTADKMQRKFGVEVNMEVPRVPYRETITVATNSEYKHKKQTGGHGQYGHVFLELQPLPRGTGAEFGERVVGGVVPKNYIPSVEKGVNEALAEGVLARYPVTDIRVTLYDGSYHSVDSSDIAFKIAASHAIRKGLTQGHPVLVEPIVNMRITVPESYTGDILGDLNSKRARVLGMNPHGGFNVIEAQAPLAEVQRYAIDLRSMTQGRGIYTMEPSHYEEVPAHMAQRIVAEREEAKG